MNKIKLHEMLENEINIAAAISNKCWDYPGEEDDFRIMLEDQGHWVWLCSNDHEPVGLCAYWLKHKSLEIVEISVRPSYRNNGVGHEMMNFVKKAAAGVGVLHINTMIREYDDEAQIWLRRQGLKCISIEPAHFKDPGKTQDGYLLSIEVCEEWKSLGET